MLVNFGLRVFYKFTRGPNAGILILISQSLSSVYKP
jgi:hypothetical protein